MAHFPATPHLRHCLCATVLLAASGISGAADTPASPLAIDGAVRLNYVYKSWQPEYPHGFVGFDTIRLDVNYDDGPVIGSDLPGQTFGTLAPNSFLMLGAFGYPYPVAAKGIVYVANVSYDTTIAC